MFEREETEATVGVQSLKRDVTLQGWEGSRG